MRWLAAGNRVTIVCCTYPGAAKAERDGDLTILRVGGRWSVFPPAHRRHVRAGIPSSCV